MNILTNRKFNTKSAVVIGKFDGVHKGHQQLLRIAADICKKENLVSIAYTFSSYGECITNDVQKSRLLAEYGMDNIYIQPFDQDFKNTSPKEFVRILKDDLCAEHVIIGFNFRFGKNRCGDASIMEKLCAESHIRCTVAHPVLFDGEPISSTRIRECIKSGDISSANAMLGRNFDIRGKIIHGKQLGRTIDFPTANMDAENIPLIPDVGVYAAFCNINGKTYPAITNIGLNPTVDHDSKIKAETNIIGFDGDLYGKELTVSFMEKLRNERTFENIDELKNQLTIDKEKAIAIFEKEQ